MEQKIYHCTIVVIANKAEVLEDYIKSLDAQTNVVFQLIVIDNKDNQYSGARKAFNSVLAQAKYDVVIFSHPDIRFMTDTALADIMLQIESLNNFGVVGIAGCAEGRTWRILSNIVHGTDKDNAGTKISNPIEVQTVDECFFAMERDVAQKNNFINEDGWHLYAVEQCLQMRRINKKNYIVPADVWHLSNGKSLGPTYLKDLERVIDEYKNDTEYINTTVKQWKTKGIRPYLYRRYYYVKQIIKRQCMMIKTR